MQQTGTLLIGVPVFLCMLTHRLDGLIRLRLIQVQVTTGDEQRTTDNITECGEEYNDRKHRQHNLRDVIVRFEWHEDGQTDEHVT